MENIDTLINRSEVITDHLNKIVHDGAHVIALPDGFSLENLERFEAQRYHPRGAYKTRDYRDLLAYAKAREADFTGSALFIDPDEMIAASSSTTTAGAATATTPRATTQRRRRCTAHCAASATKT